MLAKGRERNAAIVHRQMINIRCLQSEILAIRPRGYSRIYSLNNATDS